MSGKSLFRRVRRALGVPGIVAVVLAAGLAVPAGTPAAAAAAYPVVTLDEVTSSAGFVHPGIGVSVANLQTARQQVLAGVEPWASYYGAMLKTRFASATVQSSNKGAVIDQPGTNAFNSQGVEAKFIEDAFAAYTQSVLYVITGDPVYRENSLKIIRVWSHMDPTKYTLYPDARIHSPIPLMRLLSAAEMIRYSSVNAGTSGYDVTWRDADTENLRTNLIVPLTEKFLYSNGYYMSQQAYANVGALAGYIFTDNAERYREGVEWFSVNASAPDKTINGSLTGLIRQIDAKDPLNPYGTSFVQVEEMGRDQAHSWDGLNALMTTARMLRVQGTRLDPVAGTVSTRKNAVSPYRFGNDRLLHGMDAWYAYMMGEDIRWIDTTGGPGKLSEAYRGRTFEPMDEAYDVYRYGLGVNVEKQAPRVAKMHAQADGPIFYWGTSEHNFWDSTPDFNPEYWLALPNAVAGQNRPVQASALVQVEQRSVPFDRQSAVMSEGDRSFVRLRACGRAGATIGVRTLMYDSRNGYSPVGLMIRTNGPAKLEIRKDRSHAPYLVLSLPDTHGQWVNTTYDVDIAKIPGNLAGENVALYTFVAATGVNVDLDSVNLQAKAKLTPPSFAVGSSVTVIGVAGEQLSRALPATDAAGETVTYEGQMLPAGAAVDSGNGTLTWKPPATRKQLTYTPIVVASDATTDSVLSITLLDAPDRQRALTAALTGFDPKATYVTSTLAALTGARAAAQDAIPSADNSTFSERLIAVQAAVKGLRLLNPRLSDGALDPRGLVTSPTVTASSIWNVSDDEISTHSGDQLAPVVLDFGAGFRVTATAFGLRAVFTFANRGEGTNVYGSNDATAWTLLTSRETTNTTAQGYPMETIPVRPEVTGKSFRFLKLQVDDPGVPTDPFYPGISSWSEFRIFGDRMETAQAISSVALTSSNQVAGQAVNGDTVTLDVTAAQPLKSVSATIEGLDATVTKTDVQHWQATLVLPDDVAYGRAVRFNLDYTTGDGKVGTTVYQTTDGSALQLWNTHVVISRISRSWVNASTVPWPGPSGSTVDNAWRMFDGDLSTATDTTTANGWVTVTPNDGSSLVFDAVRIRPRALFPARANDTVVQSSTDGGTTWQNLVTITGITSDAQWYIFPTAQRQTVPMVRVLDEHGGNVNLAEVQFLQFAEPPQ
jgi:hypothetical protein